MACRRTPGRRAALPRSKVSARHLPARRGAARTVGVENHRQRRQRRQRRRRRRRRQDHQPRQPRQRRPPAARRALCAGGAVGAGGAAGARDGEARLVARAAADGRGDLERDWEKNTKLVSAATLQSLHCFDVDNTELGENQAPESMPQMRAGVSKLSMALRVCGRRPSRWSTRTSAESLTSSMAKSPLPQKHGSISSAASRSSLMGSASTTPPKVVKVGFGGRKPRMGLAGDPVV